MKRGLCLTLAALALLFCTACGSNERLDALEAQVSSLEDALSQSEAQRVSDAYDFQRQLEVLTADGEQVPPPERQSDFAAALRAGGGPERPGHRRQHLRRQRRRRDLYRPE